MRTTCVSTAVTTIRASDLADGSEASDYVVEVGDAGANKKPVVTIYDLLLTTYYLLHRMQTWWRYYVAILYGDTMWRYDVAISRDDITCTWSRTRLMATRSGHTRYNSSGHTRHTLDSSNKVIDW